MGKKIKVKSVTNLKGCRHYTVVFDMGDGTERTEVVHVDVAVSSDEEKEFVRGWLRHQFKHKADKTKLVNKTVIDVES